MNEDKVRKAFEVANECAGKCPAEYAREAFNGVFHSMIYEPVVPFHATTGGVASNAPERDAETTK